MKTIPVRTAPIIIFTLILLSATGIYSQEISLPASDSTKSKNIELADISRQSTEAILMTKKIHAKLVGDKFLQSFTKESDSVLSKVDTIFDKGSFENLESLSKRKLESTLVFWKQQQSTLENQVKKITNLLQDLDNKKFTLLNEVAKWKTTDEQLEEAEYTKAIHTRINQVIVTLDTTILAINKKTNRVLVMLDATTASESEIESKIDAIDRILIKKQQDLFKTNQPSLFALNYSSSSNWNLNSSIATFYRNELRNLGNYIAISFGYFFFHILVIIGLILLFVYLHKKNIVTSKTDLGTLYKKRLQVILSRPVSTALIVGLFLSIIIYPNPPLVFNDMMRFLVVFPIVLVLTGILYRRYHIYVYAFGAVIILQIIYINLPVNNLIGRYLLLLIGFIEAGSLFHFVYYYKKRSFKNTDNARIVLTLVYLHLTMALFGIIGNVLGKIQLSEFFETTIAGNALVATLIVLSLIVVNGFTVLFLESKYAEKANVIQQNSDLLVNKITRFFNLAALVLLVYFFLRIAGWETTVLNGIGEWFSKQRNLGSIEFSWGKLVIFFLVIWLSIYISKIVRAILEEDVLNKMKLDKGLPHTISMMVRYSLVTIGIFLAVSAAGLPFSEFAIIFGAFGVGIGFGLQNIFNNLVSGLILLFERPIKIGDTIEVGQLMGNVRSIGIRSSNVRTFDGAEIIVPNGNLISNEVINWTLSDQTRRIEVIVGVSYSSDPHKVQKILLKVLHDHKEIVKNPEPHVFFRDLGESSLDFRMLCWTEYFDQWIRIKSEIIFMVFDALKEAGIEIPFPQRDLHVRSVNPNIKFSNEAEQKDNSKAI